MFVYAGSRAEAERAREIIEAELREDGIESRVGQIEHWLAGEDRWDDEPPEGYEPEREVLEHGLAPWEVRVEAASPEEAERLAKQLQAEGLGVIRRHRYVIVGVTSEEQAQELAKRLHGVPEASGQLIYEALPDNPFAIFGALGGNTTPI